MLDEIEKIIATLEQSLRQTRTAQNRLLGKLREAEAEVEVLRVEYNALENSAADMEKTIDGLLSTMHSGNRSKSIGKSITIEDDYDPHLSERDQAVENADREEYSRQTRPGSGSVAYIHQSRGIPPISNNINPVSDRFSDRTITQACTLLLREAGRSLHVNELYNMLVSGGMRFKGSNSTISIAVSLNRNRRFRKVDPGTFDLVIREAVQPSFLAENGVKRLRSNK